MNISTTGSGPRTTVFVPGGPGLPLTFYREFIELLAASNRVVTYEMAGVWPGAPEPFPTTVGAMAAELSEAVELARSSQSAGPIVVLGHSFGGEQLRLGLGHLGTGGR
ncbi:MAG: alpha/beta fold hydrolase, partial [Spirochaetota bacterium]